MLFPGSKPDNTLRKLLDGTQSALEKGPVTIYQKTSDSVSFVYLDSYKEFNTTFGLISTRVGSVLGDSHKFQIHLYGRSFAWQSQGDYRIIMICAIDGERSYWEKTFLPAMKASK